MKFVLLLSLLLVTLLAEAKFSKGDQFQFVNIDGVLTVQCVNGTTTITCRDTFMDPWPYDIFIGPTNLSAQSVEIHSDTNGETQVANYTGRQGRSAEINLGVFSIFQKPLLNLGANNIRYALLDKNKAVLETAIFQVGVTRGPSRSCLAKEIRPISSQDCDYPYSLCQAYFKGQNDCH